MWSKIITTARALAAAWVGVLVAFEAMQRVGLVPDAPKAEEVAWVVSLVIIAGDNIGTLISRKIHRGLSVREKALQQGSMSLLIAIARHHADVRFEHLGVSVYVETLVSKVGRRLGLNFKLKRIHKFRPGQPQQSGISWVGRKGTVGQCWDDKKAAYKDWKAVAQKYGHVEVTEDEYLKIKESTRQGFTRTEFQSVCGKYSEIIAEPVWDARREGRLLGVLAVDRAYGGEDDPYIPRLSARATREQAVASASVVANILKPKGSDV
jgi:hypothetical protein